MKIFKKKIKLRKYWHWYILLPVVIGFFVATSAFNYKTQYYSASKDFVKWSSPDEAANYTFAKLYGQTGQMSVFEGYNLYTGDIMHPRSIRSDHGVLKPVSFLGIILIYGQIVKFTSYKILPYLTPLIASLALIFYYLLVKRIFKRTNALLSTLLAAGSAPLVYYSARSMFHNVLFVSLLIVGFYFLALAVMKQKKSGQLRKIFFSFKQSSIRWRLLVYSAAGGFLIGLAIITRSSELLWLGPALVWLWLFNIKKIGFIKLIIILGFMGLAILPSVYYNQILYGAPYSSGYPEMNESLHVLKESGNALISTALVGQFSRAEAAGKSFFDAIFHFGFHPRQSLDMLRYYYIGMFPYLFYPALFGGLIYMSRRKLWQRKINIYLGAMMIISLVLIFYYGSWQFFDNPDKAMHTIGNSYTRYWLPIYLGFMPLASLFIMQLSRAFCSLIKLYRQRLAKTKNKPLSNKKARQYCLFIIRLAMVAIISAVSVRFVLFGSSEGLVATASRQAGSEYEWQRILELTESNSTVITRYHDKLLFPERKVINGLFDDQAMNAEYANLANYLPIYYYNFTFLPKDLEYLNNRRLKEAGLGIKPVEKITDSFTLYRLFKINNNQK